MRLIIADRLAELDEWLDVETVPVRGDTITVQKRLYVVVAREWASKSTVRLIVADIPSKSPDAAELRAALQEQP